MFFFGGPYQYIEDISTLNIEFKNGKAMLFDIYLSTNNICDSAMYVLFKLIKSMMNEIFGFRFRKK